MTWRQLVRLAKKEYGLKKLIWKKYLNYGGTCQYRDGTVWICHPKNGKDFDKKLRTLFHELGHIHCYNNGIWKSYHPYKGFSEMTTEDKQKLIKVGLKAERWVDRWAAKQIKKYFPKFKYIGGYTKTKKTRDWFHKNYLHYFR